MNHHSKTVQLNDNDNVELRMATPSDQAAARELVSDILLSYQLTPDFNGVDRLAGSIGIPSPDILAQLVLCINNQVEGCAVLSLKQKQVGMLSGFYINPDFRGQGHGKLMLERVLNIAHSHQLEGVFLETHRKMTAAFHMYQKYGWKVIKEYPHGGPAEIAMWLDLPCQVNRE